MPAIASKVPRPSVDIRQTADLSQGWRFRYGAPDDTAGQPTLNDGDWDGISLPHTWNRVGTYGVHRPADYDSRRGVAWYRLHYQAPLPTGESKRFYLDFSGVGTIAQIWVNGVRVGDHSGAFTRFRFDVTEVWQPGKENLIAVRVDNSKPAPGSSTADVLPLSGDFFVSGGIYRGVQLIEANAVGLDLLDFGGPGVYARASSVGPNEAVVDVRSRLRNQTEKSASLTAVTTVLNARGQQVAAGRQTVTLLAGATGDFLQTLHVPHPHVWDGRADPYLYSVRVILLDGGRAVDQVIQPLGLRTFSFDADKGFFLNGRHTALHGVSRHQDWAGVGYAITDAQHDRDMALIAQMGANTIRGAHYQHADHWYDLADRSGMVMWAEVPYVSASSFDGSDGTAATFANARQQTVELIRQQYNHPSIMMWSVGNEVDASMLFMKLAHPAQGRALLQDLDALARREDPSRPTVFADCCEDTPFGRPGQQVLTGVTDLIGYNRYYGWYFGQPGDTGAELDKLHAKHPGAPLSISEYGAGGALTQHTDNPRGGAIAAFGRPHPEEFQSWVHEDTYPALAKRPYIFASWVWNMFDFASDLREEGDAIDLNDKGLVTYDRKTKKDAFFYYQATWSNEPMIHLNGSRYKDRAYPVTDIRAYTTAARARLILNGRPISSVACPDHVCVWPNQPLAAGHNMLRVEARVGGRSVSDQAVWNAPDRRAGLFLRAGTLTGGVAANGLRFGSDNWFEGGSAVALNVDIPGVKAPHRAVTGTPDPWMYETYRSGAARYALPLPDGQWTLTVHSFEPDSAKAASRRFGIRVNGKLAVDGFMPGKDAGGSLKAASRSIPVEVSGGQLSVEFVPQDDDPIVSAIEVTPRG